jgi:nucleoside-diphosphate kinase
VVHASSSEEDAEKEIKLWFEPDEIIEDIYPVKQVTLKDVQKNVWA